MIHAVDVHACGEPGRVIVGGVPPVPGDTMFAKAQYLEQHLDHIRKRMLNEPRGNPPLCCNIVLPPCHPEADIGFVIMEHVEYPGMSGSNTICTATAVLETGILPMVEPVTEFTMEAPAGLIRIRAECSNGKVNSVTFTNVPAFAVALDRPIEVPTLGTVLVDVAYGGERLVEGSKCGHDAYTPMPKTTTHSNPSSCSVRSAAKISSGAAPCPCSRMSR